MKKVLILVNRDFVLYNFRVELVEQLLAMGYRVHIALPYGSKLDEMIQMGCVFHAIEIDKRGKNPINDMALIMAYHKLFCEVKPDVILTYTTKVNIYAGIVAGYMKIPYIMNISGLGTAVEYKSVFQKFMILLYRKAAKNARCLFFQNQENLEFFLKYRIYKGRYRLIPGSGVNLSKWKYQEYPSDDERLQFLFIARVIREKGIEEYLYVAEKIHDEFPNTVFHVLGPCDGEYQDILKNYEKKGIIHYHGMVADTSLFLKSAHCTIHPSFYPEGISNVLLESAASGRPVITTNRSGCRETVEDGVTGYLVEQRNRDALYEAVYKFIKLENEERREMGVKGRNKVQREFDRKIVVDSYLEEINGL